MTERLLVLDEPLVERAPVERDVAGQERCRLDGMRIGPHRIRCDPVSDAYRPVPRLALVRRVLLPIGRLEQIGAHVFFREVIDRKTAGLVQEHDAAAVDNGLLPDERAHALRHRVPDQQRSRPVDVDVEAGGGLLAERPRSDGQ